LPCVRRGDRHQHRPRPHFRVEGTRAGRCLAKSTHDMSSPATARCPGAQDRDAVALFSTRALARRRPRSHGPSRGRQRPTKISL
jgi:hypothetical protein